MSLEEGDVVEINYIGRIENTGEIFDLTDPEVAEEEGIEEDRELKPIKVLLGKGYILESLEEKIEGMEVGEEETFSIAKENAFGSRESENIKTVSKKEFEEHEVRPHRGMPVEIDGQQGRILSVSSGRVKVDFNHPLAGRDLEYTVEIREKIEETEEQAEAILEFYNIDNSDMDLDDGTLKVEVDQMPEPVREKVEEDLEELDGIEEATVGNGEDEETEEK